MAGELGVRDEFPQSDVRSFHSDMLVDTHSRIGEFLQCVKLVGIHADQVIRIDLALGERIGAVESQVVESPGGEEAGGQGTHRRSRRHVFVLGLGIDFGKRLHFGQVRHSLCKV